MHDSPLPQLDPADPPAGAFKRFWVVLLIATALGGVLRGYGLNAGSLWIDEVWTVRDASDLLDPGRPTRYTGYIPTGIVLYAFGFQQPDISIDNVGDWRAQGLEPWHIRLAPCLIGIVSIPLLGLAVRRALGPAIAGLFMLLLACAPWHIYWSQLGRYYTLKFLLLGLALTLYYQATRCGRARLMIPSMLCVYAAFLVHPLAILIGTVFLADVALGFVRRQPIKLGLVGWLSGVGAVVAAAATLKLEELIAGMQYGQFVGADADLGQSAPLVIANAAYMLQPAVMIAALAGLIALYKLRDRSQTGAYWLFAGAMPVLVIAGFAALGKFAHTRYTMEAQFGVLVLASIGLAYAWQALLPRLGRCAAALPAALVLAAMLLLVAQYHTTGHHLHRRWVDTFAYIEQHRQPGENVVVPGPREVVGQYYLGDNTVSKLPGVRHALDRRADGKPLWVVELGGSATGDYQWKFAEHADLKAVYPIRVWQPYTELQVFRYEPRPRAQWEPEARAADAAAALKDKQGGEAADE